MYIFDTLTKNFPEVEDDVLTYKNTIESVHGEKWARIIFDDKKPNFHFVHDAFEHLASVHVKDAGYGLLMTMYEKSLDEDPDVKKYKAEVFNIK